LPAFVVAAASSLRAAEVVEVRLSTLVARLRLISLLSTPCASES